jgi:hypothetical protein
MARSAAWPILRANPETSDMPDPSITAILRSAARCVMLALLLASSVGVSADQPAPASAGSASPAQEGAPGTKDEDAPRCVHGCERWGKMCNVDPRGVYKCRRVCEKFGEICE